MSTATTLCPPITPASAAKPLSAVPLAVLRRVARAWQQERGRGQGGPSLALSEAERRALAESSLLSSPVAVFARANGYPLGTLGLLLAEETALAGLWRLREFDAGGTLRAERLEIAPAPAALAGCARQPGRQVQLSPPAPRAAAALWREIIAARGSAASDPLRVFNLTLLPLTAEDRRALDTALGHGPVSATVASLHRCDIESTRLDGVWRVRYFSAGGQLVLDTLEVAELPEALITAPEDSARALARLEEWIAREALEA